MNNIFFEVFNQNERDILSKAATTRTYSASDIVLREGEQGNTFFFITKGEMEVRKALKDRLFKPLRILGRGDMFGEIAFLGISVRSATVIANEQSEVLELSRDQFSVLEHKHPELMFKLYRAMAENMAHRLAGTSEELKEAVLAALE